MDEILCLKKLEGANEKYHSTATSSPKFSPKFKEIFFARNTAFWQIEGGEVKPDNSFFKFHSKNSQISYF